MKRVILVVALLMFAGDRLNADPGPERTLWQLCFNAEGEASFPPDKAPYDPPCAEWEYPKYAQLPIKVGMDYSALLHAENVTNAIDFWNAALGFEALIIVTEGEPDILVLGDVPNRYLLGKATPMKIDGQLHNLVKLYGLSSLGTVVHEFGHALGLAHDPGSNYVMAPIGEKRLRVHPADIVAIKALYGKE